MGLFQNNEIKALPERRLHNNKTDKNETKILNGYDGIREKLDEGIGFTVKKTVRSEKTNLK